MSSRCSASLFGLLLAGCTAVPVNQAPAALPLRMVLTWHQNPGVQAEAVAAFEAQASRIAGVRVSRLAAIDERKVAISLDCGNTPACDAAIRRLRADHRVVDLVSDHRVRFHSTAQPATGNQ